MNELSKLLKGYLKVTTQQAGKKKLMQIQRKNIVDSKTKIHIPKVE